MLTAMRGLTSIAMLAFCACNGPTAGPDGGADASESDAASVPDVDAGSPVCVADGGFARGSAVPAFGSFSGPGLDGEICLGGAFAYLERTSGTISNPSQLLLTIDTVLSGDPTTFQRITMPANATGAELTFFAGVTSAAPGTYPSSTSCGGLAFCVMLPVPTGLDCGDAGAPCPSGCELTGPVNAPTCTPAVPETCWVAKASADCTGGTQSQFGSWSLALTSTSPYIGDAGPSTDYVVHGVLTVDMVGDAGDATMTLGF